MNIIRIYEVLKIRSFFLIIQWSNFSKCMIDFSWFAAFIRVENCHRKLSRKRRFSRNCYERSSRETRCHVRCETARQKRRHSAIYLLEASLFYTRLITASISHCRSRREQFRTREFLQLTNAKSNVGNRETPWLIVAEMTDFANAWKSFGITMINCRFINLSCYVYWWRFNY